MKTRFHKKGDPVQGVTKHVAGPYASREPRIIIMKDFHFVLGFFFKKTRSGSQCLQTQVSKETQRGAFYKSKEVSGASPGTSLLTLGSPKNSLGSMADDMIVEYREATMSSQKAMPAAAFAANSESVAHLSVFQAVREKRFADAVGMLDFCPQLWISRDDSGHSLAHWGALAGNDAFVVNALSHNCPVDARAENKQTPLMWAIINGHVAVVRRLLETEADIKIADSLGASPLMIGFFVLIQPHRS